MKYFNPRVKAQCVIGMRYNKVKEYFYRAIVNTFPLKIRWFLLIRPLSIVFGPFLENKRYFCYQQMNCTFAYAFPFILSVLLSFFFPYSSIRIVAWNYRNKFKAQFGPQLLEIRKFIFRLSGKYLHFPWCRINELPALYVVGSFAAGKLHFVAYCTVHGANCRIWLVETALFCWVNKYV